MKIEKINAWFALRGREMIQKRWWILGIFTLVFTIGFTGLKHFKVTASWEDYFLEDDPMLVKTDEFKAIFGNDNFIAVLTQCDDSFTRENLKLIRELTNEMMDSLSYADKITSLTDIEFMVGTEEGMSIEQIVPDSIPSDAAGLEEIQGSPPQRDGAALRHGCEDEMVQQRDAARARYRRSCIHLHPAPGNTFPERGCRAACYRHGKHHNRVWHVGILWPVDR